MKTNQTSRLLGLGELAGLLLIAISSVAACIPGTGIEGEGPVERRTVQVPPFQEVLLRGSLDVVLVPESPAGVVVEARSNIADLVEVVVEDGRLTLSVSEGYWTRKPVVVHVTVPALDRIEVEGSGHITGKGIWRADALELAVRGSGDLELAVEARSVSASVAGSGDLTLRGSTEELNATVKGSGDIAAKELTSRRATVSVEGSGDIAVHATEHLAATVHGSGDVRYAGTPATVERNVNGSGDIMPTKQ